jgi:hypothetical protein
MRSKKSAMRSKKSTRSPRGIGAGAIGVVVVCVAAAAMLIAARQRSQPADMAAAEAQPQEAVMAETTPTTVPVVQALAKKTAAAKPSAAVAVPARTLTADATKAKAPGVEPAARPGVEAAAKAPGVESAAKAPGVESAANARVQESGVTITGCLERDADTFRLRDTTGTDAPKSRSWKSGFLKKDSASIEVVDAADALKLPDHVGQRISVTGLLVDREMQVRSLQRVAASCDQSSRGHKDGSATKGHEDH